LGRKFWFYEIENMVVLAESFIRGCRKDACFPMPRPSCRVTGSISSQYVTFALFTKCHRSVTILTCRRDLQDAHPNRYRFGGIHPGAPNQARDGSICPGEEGRTSRKWLIEVEQGKPRAEFGLILRTLKSLGVSLDLKTDSALETPSIGKAKSPDINSVLDALKKRP